MEVEVGTLPARRVCDACSVRRVRCDGTNPCRRCHDASIRCTRIRPRQKMGPKTLHRRTRDRLLATGVAHPDTTRPTGLSTVSYSCDNQTVDEISQPEQGHEHKHRLLSTATLRSHLATYRATMFSIWPVIDTNMSSSIQEGLDKDEDRAYVLASCISTATFLQMHSAGSDKAAAQESLDEVEYLRCKLRYRQEVTVESILTSFFLHIAYLHLGFLTASSLLLREAISMAHLMKLHEPSHYNNLPHHETQHHLRILWLLFITERGHALQHELTTILTISSSLPTLEAHADDLSAFISLCSLFAQFEHASDKEQGISQLASVYTNLQMIPTLSANYNSLQRADLVATQQWMRLLLWKMAMSKVAMNSESSGRLDSMLLPINIARDFISSMSAFSIDALRAHGQGMELKLFALASSLVDIINALPPQTTNFNGAQEYLYHLTEVLAGLENRGDSIMILLHESYHLVGLGTPRTLRIQDISESLDNPGDEEVG